MFLIVETEIVEGDTVRVGSTVVGPDVSSGDDYYVRRPLRGIQLKRESFATIVVTGSGSTGSLANSSVDPRTPVSFTSNFILQRVSEQRQEKFQPLTTFGPTYGFFFGEQPRLMNFSGVLMNTADFQWEIEWWANYDTTLRGTQLANKGARVQLSFDDQLVEGYLTTSQTDKEAQNPHEVPLNFTMWVTDVVYLVTPGEPQVAARHLDTDTLAGELGTGFGSLEEQREALSGASVTAAVRAANIQAINASGGTGLLGKLAAAADKVEGFIDGVANTMDTVKDWLYGRNMVIPAGFAGAESYSGHAVFAGGSGAEELIGEGIGGILRGVAFDPNNPQGSTISIRVPGVVTGGASLGRTYFADNLDEYPARGVGSSAITQADLEQNPSNPWEEDNLHTQLAEATFAEFGYDIKNDQGQAASDLERTAGRATFIVLSYAAMATGFSQAAASLTVGNATASATS